MMFIPGTSYMLEYKQGTETLPIAHSSTVLYLLHLANY